MLGGLPSLSGRVACVNFSLVVDRAGREGRAADGAVGAFGDDHRASLLRRRGRPPSAFGISPRSAGGEEKWRLRAGLLLGERADLLQQLQGALEVGERGERQRGRIELVERHELGAGGDAGGQGVLAGLIAEVLLRRIAEEVLDETQRCVTVLAKRRGSRRRPR